MFSKEEQETTITFCRGDKYAEIYTSDKTVMTRLDKLVNNGDWSVKHEEIEKGQVISKIYVAPTKLISFRSNINKVNITEEERRKRAERLTNNRD